MSGSNLSLLGSLIVTGSHVVAAQVSAAIGENGESLEKELFKRAYEENAMFKADCKVVMSLAALIVAGTALFAADEEHTGAISGVVKNASGQAVSGAYVKARNTERGLLFMVVSQDQGRYGITNLPAGNYKVQGIGGTVQSDSAATVVVASGKEVSANLTLNGPRPDRPNEPWRSTGPPLNDKEREALKVHESWLASRVASQVPEGPGKAIFTSTCSVCHSLPVNERGSREDWAETVAEMIGRGAVIKSEEDKNTVIV